MLGTTIIACNNTSKQEEISEHAEHTHYQCPMKCEGDKFYEEAGKCPVCEMDLKEME